MPQIPFVGPSYKARSSNFDAQVCVNLFPVLGESGAAKSVRALYGTPGTRPLAVVSGGPVRAIHVPTDGSDAVVVVGHSVYRMSKKFVLTKIGDINLVGGVDIADNGTQAILVNDGNGYTLDLTTNTLTEIVADGFYGSSNVDFLATFFILNRPRTNQFYISGSGAVTFDALDFASAESNAEPIIAHIVSHGELLLFKETVTEVWRASGGADFPFARDGNAGIEQGCAARRSVATMDNSVFWLGKNSEGGGVVWRLNGYTPQRVSTDAIEYAIASYPDIADATAFTYQQEGHTFYQLNFPSGNATWVYDAATQLWHQRAYLDPHTGTLGRHRADCHVYYAGKHVVGDYETGELYVLDLDYYLDRAADPMPAIRAAAYVASANYGWIPHRRLQVDMETGVGSNDGQGISPVALLDWSDDGGKEWSNQRSAPLGSIGNRRVRARWNRLGRALNRIYRLTITDPVKRVIIGAVLNPES